MQPGFSLKAETPAMVTDYAVLKRHYMEIETADHNLKQASPEVLGSPAVVFVNRYPILLLLRYPRNTMPRGACGHTLCCRSQASSRNRSNAIFSWLLSSPGWNP